jgi:hypothetical protein
MTKNFTDESIAAKRKFRGKLGQRDWSKMEQDPNFEYRWVITTYKNNIDPYERVEQFIDKGWDVVYSEDRPVDERTNAPDNTKDNSDRLKPVTKRLASGHIQILMKCSKERRQQNEVEKAKKDKQRELASIKKITQDVDLSKREDVSNDNELGD